MLLLSHYGTCFSQSDFYNPKADSLYSILKSEEFEEYKSASRKTTAFIRSGGVDFQLLQHELLANPDQMAAPSEEFLRGIPGAVEYSELSSREVRWLDSLDRKFGYLTLLSEDDLDILLSVYNELQNKELPASEIKSLLVQRLEEKR